MLDPSGRQVKMAFIHTAAKPPRDVRIQQELHGTAVHQPPQLGPRLVSALQSWGGGDHFFLNQLNLKKEVCSAEPWSDRK